jgi:hypothetical protein
MREVRPTVGQHRLIRGVGQQPPTDAVVHPAVREQQPVGRFMGEDVETDMTTRHQHEGEQVRPPGVDPRRCDHDAERLDQCAGDRDRVAGVGEMAEFATQRLRRLGSLVEAVGGQDVGEHRRIGHHRTRHERNHTGSGGR